MNDVPKTTAIVEYPPDHRPSEGSTSNFRIRQQEILAELGVLALQGTPLHELLKKTASLTSEGLQAEFCKVLEYQPKEGRFLVTAGVGWGPDVIGVATVGADIESPAGYALITGKPVISNHLENEERFRTPELLAKNGIRRAMNVILQGDGSPYGVLEADSRSEGEFSINDISFLQGAANILGMAIERQRIEANLRAALERNQLLMKEVNHRVTNSLALVASMLRLKSATVGLKSNCISTKRHPALWPLLALISGFIRLRCSRGLRWVPTCRTSAKAFAIVFRIVFFTRT